jgi:ABC-type multidrug transport system permease subunit
MSMRPTSVYQLELAAVFSNTRSIFMKLGYAYLLGLPFALIQMPATVRVIGITMLILFTSFFGAATSLVTRRTEGQMARLGQLPIRRSSLYSDFLLSGAVIDIAQVGVVLILLLLVNGNGVSLALAAAIAATFVLSVLFLNILGMLLGLVSKNSQEVHLIGALGVGIIGFLSGLFPTPDRIEGLIAASSSVSPLHMLAVTMEWGMDPEAVAAVPVWQSVGSVLVLAAAVALFVAKSLSGRSMKPLGVRPDVEGSVQPRHEEASS